MGCIKVGICAYCGQARNVSTEEDLDQEQLDELATEQCECPDGYPYRKKKMQREACLENIRELIAEKDPGIAKIFESCINPLQEGEFKSVTIDTGYGKKARIKDTKDGLKIELEEKKKDEALA